MNRKTKMLVEAAIIAALYVVLTEISAFLGLSSGVIQVRISEALNVLSCFTVSAVPGLYIGCVVANLITGAVIWDVLFGSLATLIGAAGVYLLKKYRVISLLCPVFSNAVIVPIILKYAYGFSGSIWFFVITVAAGQIVSSTVFGSLLGKYIDKHRQRLFK